MIPTRPFRKVREKDGARGLSKIDTHMVEANRDPEEVLC